MEVDASLRERGLEVTVVGMESVPFEHTLGASVGRAWQKLHERRGVPENPCRLTGSFFPAR